MQIYHPVYLFSSKNDLNKLNIFNNTDNQIFNEKIMFKQTCTYLNIK